jgi:hypothetical protein
MSPFAVFTWSVELLSCSGVRPEVAPRCRECCRQLEEQKGGSPWDGHLK